MKNFGRNSSYKRRDDREDRQMYHATCADCGRSCEVPFRPSGDKPVYCSNCFKRDESPKRGGRDDRGRGGRQDMHRATCADCGRSCEVPFRPIGDKPVYCSDCFVKGSGPSSNKPEKADKRNEEINAKLDKILSLLGRIVPPFEAKEVATKKTAPKKAEKKVVKKKPAKKKSK